jgi:hypothetical protein
MCLRIFKTIRIRTEKKFNKFCKTVGQKSTENPGHWLSACTTRKKENSFWRKHETYRIPPTATVNLVPDLTKKQRAEETKTQDKADRRNKDVTGKDREKKT